MRALGLDIGSARIGVAVSDPTGCVASPIAVLDAAELARDVRALADLVEDYDVESLVVGLPLTLGGEEGPQAAEVRDVAERFAVTLGIPVEYYDERHSSAEAKRSMRASGMSEREQRGSIDKVAAAIVLQGWLDARRQKSGRRR
ncbi:MAG: Holliday junction resolvase RuvX [Coriobacteriia bacterium]|nr:Holliday junction resolvase RuvX [Coriobacteriia bacterium]